MSISASMVKELREKTGAGMMDCKKALEESAGDLEKAIDWLRQKGLAKAAKRADRATTEGIIGFRMAADEKSATIIEIKCETDFVARGDKFLDFANAVTDQVANDFTPDQETFLAQAFIANPSTTVQEAIGEAIAAIGENILIGRMYRLAVDGDGLVGGYVHSNGKLATLVAVTAGSAAAASSDVAKEFVKNVAMQAAATNPITLDSSSLDPTLIERERDVYRQKAKEEGKPDNIIEKIADGAVKKYCKEVCLMDQPYIREEKLTIADLQKQVSKEAGADLTIVDFVRIQLGG